MNIEKPTLAEKQAFWAEQLPLFKEAYWLPEHFEFLKFDMEAGNFIVRDDIDSAFEDDADDLYHRINTGWSMWKRAINHMQKNLEGCVVVPVESLRVAMKWMNEDINAAYVSNDGFKELFEHKPLLEKAMVEAARGGNE
ncbi:hypothetical protein F889_02133 [Acinetobacter colistiniresistens]|uniref:Uncharacterized protein n=1 Tax=Acinetobacter colistiniresistens TaxID=280145 RepID=N9PJ52_9GAMM|nr:hypothetical protein [Acinetobacter colistiniresistens]ENX33473.1 hypothetical protein F889_02133 [Acinetobacter colistiniresistens]